MAKKTNRVNKDKEMAAYMKKMGIERKECNCPICHRLVSLRQLYNHIVTHR